MDKNKDSTNRERRLDEVIAEYLQAAEQQTQRLKDWLVHYPEFESELEAFIADDERAKALFKDATGPITHGRPDFGHDYERIEEIGRGGMGTVYRAYQKKLGRFEALKTIHTGFFDTGEERVRLRREAQAAAKLNHPNIVTVYGFQDDVEPCFLAMEYIEGQSLRDALANGPLPPQQAASILQRVAKAIQYAHDSNVLHRDIKPSNILIDSFGQPKVSDFGLAKVVGQDNTQFTSMGAVLGTASYASTEQAAGDNNAVGPRSDVYSLGATLYEAITGVPPFSGENPQQILRQVLQSEAERPRMINPKIPEDLETICLRCLEKFPEKRYGSARELAEDLQRFINGEPIQARPIGNLEQIWRTVRNRVTIASLGLTAGPIVGLLVAIGSRSSAGYVAAIAAWMMIWWITEAVPAAATAFLPLALFPVLGILPADEVAKSYVEDDLFLFLGGMLIALGFEDSGISRRFALKVILWFGRNPRTVLLALMCATAFISLWVSNTASTLIMLPIAFGLILHLESEPSAEDTKNLRKALMLGIAYAATIGGMGTPVGTPANQQLLLFVQLSFLRWLAVGLPCVILLTSTAWFLLCRVFPLSGQSSFIDHKRIATDLGKMGSISTREWRMVIIGIITASMWVLRVPLTQSASLPVNLGTVKDGTIAMVMALVCFIIPSGKERGEHLLESRVISKVPWSVWLLFGGGLALAEGIRTSGLDRALGGKLTYALGILPPFRIIGALVVAATGTILTQLSSNFSTAKILLPILDESVRRFAPDVQAVLMMTATLAVSCDFMFPFSTPPNAIVFGAGKLTIRDMLKVGFWLTLIGVVVIATSVAWLLRAP